MDPTELRDLARLAYADGFARSGGPLTERVKTGCTIAVTLAAEHHDQPGILEATVDLGHLEGTWALVTARREALYAPHVAAVMKAWRALLRRAPIRAGIRQMRQQVGEASDPERDRRTAAAAAAAVLALHIVVDPTSPAWQAFVAALASGMRIAQAEGVAGAIGVAAAHAGVTGIDFQAAYDHALLYPPTGAPDTAGAAQVAATGIVRAATRDLTRSFAASEVADLNLTDAEAAALDALAGDTSGDGVDDPTAAGLLTDQAISRSFLAGALSWYAAQGVVMVDFIAQAGACPICEAFAAASPYTIYDVPTPQIHPRCRCSTSPVDPVVGFDFTAYLF